MRWMAGVMVFLVLTTGLISAGTDEFRRLLTEGEEWYRKGINGDEQAVDKAIERLESALELNPGHPLAMVFLGSCYTLVARDKKNPLAKLKWAKRGLELIDQAVEQDPADGRIRLERFMNNLNLPGILKREAFVRSDLEFLTDRIDRSPVPDDHRQNFYVVAGDYLHQEGEVERAVDFWRRCLAINPESLWGRRAADRLRVHQN